MRDSVITQILFEGMEKELDPVLQLLAIEDQLIRQVSRLGIQGQSHTTIASAWFHTDFTKGDGRITKAKHPEHSHLSQSMFLSKFHGALTSEFAIAAIFSVAADQTLQGRIQVSGGGGDLFLGSEQNELILVLGQSPEERSFDVLGAEVRRTESVYRFHMLGVEGRYLMSTSVSWRRVTTISRDIRWPIRTLGNVVLLSLN